MGPLRSFAVFSHTAVCVICVVSIVYHDCLAEVVSIDVDVLHRAVLVINRPVTGGTKMKLQMINQERTKK